MLQTLAEHIGAISWLNESATSFYLIKVEAVKISNSPPAALLTLIVGPSEESRKIGDQKKEWSEREKIRHKFWTQLLDRAREKTKWYTSISPSSKNNIGRTTGRKGLSFWNSIRQHDADVVLYIDRGTESEEIFERLAKSKEAIEKAFDEPLEWQRVEGKRFCRIKKQFTLGGYRDKEKWPEIQDAMIDAMIRLEKAFQPHIDKLPV